MSYSVRNPIIRFFMNRDQVSTVEDASRKWGIPYELLGDWAESSLVSHEQVFRLAEHERDEDAKKGLPGDVHNASVERYVPVAQKFFANNNPNLLLK